MVGESEPTGIIIDSGMCGSTQHSGSTVQG
jgi:hypothetical protein